MDIKKKKSGDKVTKVSKEPKKQVSLDLSCGAKIAASVIGTVWLFALLVVTVGLIYSVVYAHVSFPGATLSEKDVSNLSRHDLEKVVKKRVNEAASQKWQITLKDKKADATSEDLGMSFDASKTTEIIWNFGRTENFFVNIKDQFVGLVSHHNYAPVDTIDAATLDDFVSTKLASFEKAPKNATIGFNEHGAMKIVGSEPGRVVDADLIITNIQKQIAEGTKKNVSAVTYAKTPDVTSNIARASRQRVAQLLASPITLTYQDKTWSIPSTQIEKWISPVAAQVQIEGSDIQATNNAVVTLGSEAVLDFTKTPQTNLTLAQTADEIQEAVLLSANQDKPLNIREFMNREFGLDKSILANNPFVLAITIDKVKLDQTFDPITETIDIPGKNAQLAYQDGHIVVLAKSEDGRGVDRVDALKKILDAVNDNKERSVALTVNTIPAKVTEANYASLGISELLATGESNFVGSPRNRQHNIHTAASHFEGVLVAPGEEFSFVNYLGDVDASTGYLPELVIKGNKITPEFGGGVCQVSSTLFRAAVYAGLDITERQNHSFVVSYYGTPGMDATIYIPHPDLKFVNNTPGYILMQPRFDGTRLYFDIFGTSDGRSVTTQGPYIYDRSAGNAMKATWTQIVKTASGETKTKVFRSSYKPVTDFVHTN